ncbi:MAG: NUDIX domain-containing protein, partial [Firmicutes bacterium]|nr:NUDIX domain-containing protein [Bacillota bacterium]
MSEEITLVDLNDEILGYETKEEVHRSGMLHRAFSVFIVNEGRMLLQRRNPSKYHSGGLWSNACCSHQRKGEVLTEAVHRRMKEELGFDCRLEEQFTFIYRTVFAEDLIEYELDHVFLGKCDPSLCIDPEEVAETR